MTHITVLALFVWWCQISPSGSLSLSLPLSTTVVVNRGSISTQRRRSGVAFASALSLSSAVVDPEEDASTSASTSASSPIKSRPISTGSTPSLPKRIVTCSSTNELVHAVEAYIHPHHKVAELGSQLRQVSTRICEQCHHATLVDVQRKFPKARAKDTRRTEAMRLPPHPDDQPFFPDKSTFCELVQLSDWTRAFFDKGAGSSGSGSGSSSSGGYDVLVLDVNAIVGNDLEWTSLELIQQFISHNAMMADADGKELLVLVKSMGLNKWANRLIHANHWQDHQELLQQDSQEGEAPRIIATVGVQEYRATIPSTVRSTDFVLEVGCHFGTTTALLHDAAEHCIGVDVGKSIIRDAKQRHLGKIDFRVGDAWKTAELLRFQQDYLQTLGERKDDHDDTAPATIVSRSIGYDVVYVDVGGLSGSDGLREAIQLISSIQYALEPRCIVIKSLCMQRLSSKLVPFWQLQKRARQSQF